MGKRAYTEKRSSIPNAKVAAERTQTSALKSNNRTARPRVQTQGMSSGESFRQEARPVVKAPGSGGVALHGDT